MYPKVTGLNVSPLRTAIGPLLLGFFAFTGHAGAQITAFHQPTSNANMGEGTRRNTMRWIYRHELCCR